MDAFHISATSKVRIMILPAIIYSEKGILIKAVRLSDRLSIPWESGVTKIMRVII